MNPIQELLDHYAEQQGWTEYSKVFLLTQFLSNQLAHNSELWGEFEVFISDVAKGENDEVLDN